MKKNSGLTLIELLVVMGLIGILASALITLINPLSQIAKANDSRRKSDLAQIQRALELYYNSNKAYPGAVTFDVAWLPYMPKVPKDPNSSIRNYAYDQIDSNTYCLFASLEYAGDTQKCSTVPCPKAASASPSVTCGGDCNYGVCSSNITPE